MPLSQRDASYLWDIVDSARLAMEATREIDLAGYETNRMAQLAVERCVELIGEAVRRLSEDYKASRPTIPWSRIIGQRNDLAHEYRDIQNEKLWRLTRVELPHLVAELEPDLPPPPGAD